MTTADTSQHSEMRDFGPFVSEEQALRQFEATVIGAPLDSATGALMVLNEALTMSGLADDMPDYERAYAAGVIAMDLPPAVVQVIASWLLRASDLD